VNEQAFVDELLFFPGELGTNGRQITLDGGRHFV
jgi:hypothetical protein